MADRSYWGGCRRVDDIAIDDSFNTYRDNIYQLLVQIQAQLQVQAQIQAQLQAQIQAQAQAQAQNQTDTTTDTVTTTMSLLTVNLYPPIPVNGDATPV